MLLTHHNLACTSCALELCVNHISWHCKFPTAGKYEIHYHQISSVALFLTGKKKSRLALCTACTGVIGYQQSLCRLLHVTLVSVCHLAYFAAVCTCVLHISLYTRTHHAALTMMTHNNVCLATAGVGV